MMEVAEEERTCLSHTHSTKLWAILGAVKGKEQNF